MRPQNAKEAPMAEEKSFQTAAWTQAIYARLQTQWEAWKNRDAASNDAVIHADFEAYCPDSTRRSGKPTAQQMANEPISGYALSQLRVVPVGGDVALVTYFAEIETPDSVHHHMAAGEFWTLREGEWFIRGFSGTLMGESRYTREG
jgi:hypothetical protein